MIVLGIETSCDETAVGIVDGARAVLANEIASQIEVHRAYGGVVPEIAARAHLDQLGGLAARALAAAGMGFGDIDGIAATCGPGLIGGVMVGAMFGKGIAAARKLPFVDVNHLEAHALTARLTHDVPFPYLLLLVTGGHCQLLLARGVGDYAQLGGTIDDAVGECFDKCAKLMGLPYPGGPAVEAAARGGMPRIDLPRPMLGRKDGDACDFSFSGLKTAVRQAFEAVPARDEGFVADLCASLQLAIGDILVDRTENALSRTEGDGVTALVVAGGVAANQALGARLTALAGARGLPCIVPPPALCTDNGVMIAWAGLERLRLGLTGALDAPARPRWPLSELGTRRSTRQ
ncbi:MAG: tRNA (adenosine(37)-N6)-threonylcarbamoyltransferase complex transferase subunit TsaD [Alphaproteobacteria bacterium]|nr:tRNA (adenosine(37)-N6)-threonylcarbamoyltransferase complex transferase subunit TsaD [Alphaproteobacteria bacterium]